MSSAKDTTVQTSTYSTVGTNGQMTVDGQAETHTEMETEQAMGANGQMMVDGVLGITMSRRRALRLLGAAGVTAVLAGATQLSSASAAQQLRTLSSLNLRSKPRGDARVLRVMPEGAIVTRIPGGAGRYVKVIYDGSRGYAHLDYLDDATDQGPDPTIVGVAVTTTSVNLRSGPSTSHQVLRVLGEGVEVSVSDKDQNGFRYVIHNGLAGWVWDAYLAQRDGGDGGAGVRLTTTAAVNFRTSASTSASVIQVIPSGAVVYGLGERSNGFEKVRHGSKTGWISATYLR